ncbi:MAG: esterase-like activity of phytase family protein [Bacteroidetes bacterium]|nr:esterase-like activity of phytase family protein [Bacteroidota bacterium]
MISSFVFNPDRNHNRHFFTLLIGLMLVSHVSHGQAKQTIRGLRYLQTFTIPYNTSFEKTRVGGLSGVDYIPEDKSLIFISDDKQARFYEARLHITGTRIDSLHFLNVWPMVGSRPGNADAESIRFNRQTQQLFWSDEGERKVGQPGSLINPSVHIADLTGKETGQIILPEILHMKQAEGGPRNNGALEGITFNKEYSELFTCLEEPLMEDGPRASLDKGPFWVRFFQLGLPEGKQKAQYAYALEPVAYPSAPADGFKVNGISEILYLGGSELLVIERSFSTGKQGCVIKVFKADFSKATDVKEFSSLGSNQSFVPMQKTLLLNMESLGVYVDNVEGVTFGPALANGHRSLLFVSDNNFQETQETQLLLFEVFPEQ